MALREDQILRYSRQILLREVGGRGQQKLLDAPVTVDGASDVLDVAAAYLAASGTPLLDRTTHGGFLAGTSLESFAPDAVAVTPAKGWLGSFATAPTIDVSLFRVAVSNGGLIGVPGGMPWPGELEGQGSSDCVTLGALAALVVQRFALGLESSLVKVRNVDGRWQRE